MNSLSCASRCPLGRGKSVADGAQTGARRRSKVPLLATVALILVVGSLAGWGVAKFMTAPAGPGANIDLPKSAALVEKPTTGKDVARAPNASPSPVAASPGVTVDSYAPDAVLDLKDWKQGKQLSGYFDSVALNGVILAKTATPTLNAASDILMLSGWAGEINVGIRYPFVVASVCGDIVAHAAVREERPDVAKAVHPNLTVSGWRMRVAAASIPTCEDSSIRVWGVAPGQTRLILPLNGRFSLNVSPRISSVSEAAPLEHPAPLTREMMPQVVSLALKVTANTLNIRRCGDAECAITGKFRKGVWPVVKMDQSADWLLVATPERAGWVARKYVQVEER
jgi:hypothetical protein